MKISTSILQLRAAITAHRHKGASIGFVPTMGALHEGHLSLLRRCKKENNISVLSIFVNPTQFGPNEDLQKYPRDKKADVSLAKKEKVDIIFYPSEKMIYPPGYLTVVDVGELGNVLCGRSRPGHFRGVATVVAKLLNLVTPDTLYLGAKDAQQCVVLKRMITDLNFAVKVKVCPIVREADGLALSSRNRYLSAKERKEAPVLFRSLQLAAQEIKRGERSASRVRYLVEQNIREHSGADVEYVACVNPQTLHPAQEITGEILIALAAHFGTTRLIDNMTVKAQS